MKTVVNLESKDVRKIIAKFLGIPEGDVIPNRYSFGVTGLTVDEINGKLEADKTEVDL